jgi:membrane protein
MSRSELKSLVTTTVDKWNAHNAPRLGAALAYYMLLSMAPLLILSVTICGLVFSESTAQQKILVQVRELAGAAGERVINTLINNITSPRSGLVATAVALVTLLVGASGVFLELRDSLNTIWDIPKHQGSLLKTMLWQRLISFGMVLALGLLLLVSLLLSAAMAIAEKFFFGLIPMNVAILGEVANFVIPLAATTILFSVIFKFVPDVELPWRDIAVGALLTALMFSIGKMLLAFYLGTVGVGSTYGAAGSLVAFVVWVYYSAQIFFFGAILTKNYAVCCGSLSAKNKTIEPPRSTPKTRVAAGGQGV